MIQLTAINFLVLSALALILQVKRKNRIVSFIHALLVINVGLVLGQRGDDAANAIIYTITGLIAANFIASQFVPELFRKPIIRIFFPTLSVLLLFLFHWQVPFTYGAETFAFGNKFLLLAVVLALISYDVAVVKDLFIGKWFVGKSQPDIIRAVQVLLLGMSMYLAMFAAGTIGIFTAAGSVLLGNFYRKGDDSALLIPVLIFSLLVEFSMRSASSIVSVDPDIIAALFIGVFGTYFFHIADNLTKGRTIMMIASLLMTTVLSVIFIWLGTQFGQLGGGDAFVGILIGIALTTLVIGKEYLPLILFGFIAFTGLVSLPFLADEESMKIEPDKKTHVVEKTAPINVNYTTLEGLEGGYTLVSDSSAISFLIGPKLETKGAIRKISGTFDFSESKVKRFKIKMDVANLTTFNRMRDESLMTDEYFNQPKYPEMRFEGSTFREIGNDEYEIEGAFTLMGVTKREVVTLRREDQSQPVLVGSGKIDRTAYGMMPSSTEGNIVEFTYRIVLKAK